MGISLQVKNTDLLTLEDKKELDMQINEAISKHKANSTEINKLVFNSVTSLIASESRRDELEEQGILKRFLGGLTGKNKSLQSDIDRNLQKAQYGSQQILKNLAEQNLMSFELITAVNNKLNSSIIEIDNEINEIYKILTTFFKQTKSDLLNIENRLEKLEKNVNVLNWVNTIPYLAVDGVEYSDLDKMKKIEVITKDFYEITEGKWTTTDLLQLKPAITQIDLSVKEKIKYKDFIIYMLENNNLFVKLIDEDIKEIEKNGTSIINGLVKGKHLDSDEEYLLDTLELELKEYGVNLDRNKLKYSMIEKYIAKNSYVDINLEVNIFDFILELLYNIQNLHNVMIEVYENFNIHDEQLKELDMCTLKKYAEKGNLKAQLFLGNTYFYGEGIEVDLEEAFKWYLKSAEQGNEKAQYNLGIIYQFGRGVEVDLEEAFKWYLKSAENGNEKAIYDVGMMYEFGIGVEKDFEKAIKWYLKSAEQGSEDAQYKMANYYYEGIGVKQNYNEAVYWYKRSSGNGDSFIQYRLGLCHQNGEGVEIDYKEAVYWYKVSAEQGNVEAQYRLGLCYQNGEGVERDYKEAVYWYKISAEQGNVEAQNRLGIRYHNGEGVEQNLEEAFKWYLKSAEQGWHRGQYNLAQCYFDGHGVKKNYAEARKWYKKAAQQGNENAEMALATKRFY